MKPTRRTQPQRKMIGRPLTGGLKASLRGATGMGTNPADVAQGRRRIGGNVTGPRKGLPSGRPVTTLPKVPIRRGSPAQTVTGGKGVRVLEIDGRPVNGRLGDKLSKATRGQKLARGQAPAGSKAVGVVGAKRLTNTATTGPAKVRRGQSYYETVDKKGREIHVYDSGKRVVDLTPDGVDKSKPKAGLGGPADPARSTQPVDGKKKVTRGRLKAQLEQARMRQEMQDQRAKSRAKKPRRGRRVRRGRVGSVM